MTRARHLQFLRYLRAHVFRRSCATHVHVEYQGNEALVAIADGGIVKGGLPRRAHALVKQWCIDHQAELAQNWSLAQALQPLNRIPGADND